MAMNDQQPPWGRKNKPQTPEEMVAQLIRKLQEFFSEDKSQGQGPAGEQPSRKPTNPFAGLTKLFILAGVVLLLQGVYASVFKINPGEVGVILRLGKYNKTTQSGLHFKLPFIDTLYKVDVEKSGSRSSASAPASPARPVPSTGATMNPKR